MSYSAKILNISFSLCFKMLRRLTIFLSFKVFDLNHSITHTHFAVQVSDLTICLDRRGSQGKIEVYQDPLLYRYLRPPDHHHPVLHRCSLTARVSWCYPHITSKTPHRMVMSVLAERMEWSLTGVQVILSNSHARVTSWYPGILILTPG